MFRSLIGGGLVALALCFSQFTPGSVDGAQFVEGGKPTCTGSSEPVKCDGVNCTVGEAAYSSTVPVGQLASAVAGTSTTICVSGPAGCFQTTIIPPNDGCNAP